MAKAANGGPTNGSTRVAFCGPTNFHIDSTTKRIHAYGVLPCSFRVSYNALTEQPNGIQLSTAFNTRGTIRSHLDVCIQINDIAQSTRLRTDTLRCFFFFFFYALDCVWLSLLGIFAIDQKTMSDAACSVCGRKYSGSWCNLIRHQTDKPSGEWQIRRQRNRTNGKDEPSTEYECQTHEQIGDCDWREHTIFRQMRVSCTILAQAIVINWFRRVERNEETKKRIKRIEQAEGDAPRNLWVRAHVVCVEFPFFRIRYEFPNIFWLSPPSPPLCSRVFGCCVDLGNDFEVSEAIYKWPSSARLDHNRLRMSYAYLPHSVVRPFVHRYIASCTQFTRTSARMVWLTMISKKSEENLSCYFQRRQVI